MFFLQDMILSIRMGLTFKHCTGPVEYGVHWMEEVQPTVSFVPPLGQTLLLEHAAQKKVDVTTICIL